MATTQSRRKRGVVIAIAAALILGGSGAAFAYWSSSGTGTGGATTGESVAFTITSEDAVGTIAPGNAGQTVDFTVTNPGPGTQYLALVTVALATSEGTEWAPPAGCDFADYSATITTVPPAGSIVAGGFVEGTVTVTLANTAENQDACQNAAVPLYFVAS